MLFQPYIVIYQNVQGHSAVAWPPLCTKSKCFISSQNFFTLWPGKLHMISDRDIYPKNHWVLVRFFSPEAPLDGVGVALKVKVRESNDDLAC